MLDKSSKKEYNTDIVPSGLGKQKYKINSQINQVHWQQKTVSFSEVVFCCFYIINITPKGGV